MVQRSSGYGYLVRVGAVQTIIACVAFGNFVRIRVHPSEHRARFGRRTPFGARTYDRAAHGPWALQQENRPSIEYRSLDIQVACEAYLFEADGADPRPSGRARISGWAALSQPRHFMRS